MALFALVVEAKGFSAAARRSGTPQATVSRRIAALERAMGLDLLDRTTRRMTLTEAGRRVYAHARLIRDQAEAAQAAVTEISGDAVGDLRITAPVILGQTVLSRLISRFLAQHPRINLHAEWTGRGIDPSQDNVDVAIQLGAAGNDSLVAIRLGETRTRLYAPPNYSGAVPEHPSDLAALRIAGLGPRLDVPTVVFVQGETAVSVDIPRRLMSNDVTPVIETAQTCDCFAMLPDFCEPLGWTSVLPDWQTPPIAIHALRTVSSGSLPKVRLFIEALKKDFADRARSRLTDMP